MGKKVQKQDRKNKLQNLFSELSDFLPESTLSFIKSQVLMAQRSKQGLRWCLHDKMLALSIFYHSKRAYKILQRFFKLPSRKTLQRMLQKSNVCPGFNDSISKALRMKIDTFPEIDKTCALIFDEISLKSALTYDRSTDSIEGFENFGTLGQTKYVANHALAFMVRGLHSKWKQPVGYFLSAGPVSSTILSLLTRQCLEKLSSVGLVVKALICDQGSNNRSFLEKEFGISTNKPFFCTMKKEYMSYTTLLIF